MSPGAPVSVDGPAIEIRGLTKRFGAVTAVQALDLSVAPRETVALWGANGAGKTTVLRCLLGLMPFEGSVRVLGREVPREGRAVRALMGYVPQEIRLQGEETVRQTVTFYARLRGVDPQAAIGRLAAWRLEEAVDRPVRGLSGGMKQKLALIIALLSDPPILLLDEPTSSLDAESRRELSNLLDELKRSGKTMVCCLHRPGEVWKLADRVVVLAGGRKTQDGRPEEVLSSLQSSAVVCLTVARELTGRAAAVLEAGGLTVQRNGMQLWVSVPWGRKAEPISRLAAAEIPILDVEVGDER